MKLLLVAATKAELNNVFELYKLQGENFITHTKFDILITGVGMTATAFALGKYLNSNYNLVVNLGIAGSFDQDIPLGSLVNIETDTFAELGAEDQDNFITINQLGFGENTYAASYLYHKLPKVKGITVNKVHGNVLSIAKTLNKFNPQTESMEGAAVFYACKMNNVPCLQVRAISNYVEPRNKENWQINLAINNLNNWIINFIENKH
jgi:futalosine hydrolase